MKMVKSLLLGSAAGLVAVTAGQAADLPVKAKPVEYVKVCNLYGAGFYYMPGTDMCIKIGGWVRAEAGYGYSGNLTWGPFNGNANVRSTSNLTYRARGYITADAREQTAYGTARGYIAVGLSTSDTGLNTSANQFSANRAFVQWAGFTGGIAQSLYDYYSVPATSYNGAFPASDTGDPGWTVFAYTAQLGNGLSASISAEERRMTQIINVDPTWSLANAAFATVTATTGGGFEGIATGTTVGSLGGIGPGAYPNADNLGPGSNPSTAGLFPGAGAYGGFQAPDVVANLRVDQGWGGAQIMGALHELNANAYNVSSTGTATMTSGHPGDRWGYAIGAGFKLNAPMIAQGDYIQTQFNYTDGASRYLFFTPNTNWGYNINNKGAYGVLSDAVYGSTGGTAATGTGLQLTSAWGFNAAYEHFWTPSLHSSFYGAYDRVMYNSTANNGLCALENNAAGAGALAGTLFTAATAGCNNNWGTYIIGSRTQFDVNKNFYLGVDIFYQRLITATSNVFGAFASGTPGGAGQTYAVTGSTVVAGTPGVEQNLGAWTFRFRAHKDFLP